MCIDQTRKFSYGSFKGKNCMLLTYSRGTNPILCCLLKYKKGHEFILDLEEIHLFAETEALDLSITF